LEQLQGEKKKKGLENRRKRCREKKKINMICRSAASEVQLFEAHRRRGHHTYSRTRFREAITIEKSPRNKWNLCKFKRVWVVKCLRSVAGQEIEVIIHLCNISEK